MPNVVHEEVTKGEVYLFIGEVYARQKEAESVEEIAAVGKAGYS